MKHSSLFPEDHRDVFSWQAYVSSALTMRDAQACDRIKKLNSSIKDWLEESSNTFVYLPQDYSDPSRGDKMRSEEIYILDRWRIAESDFIIMNLDTPSFGVGQEAEIACSMGIPIIAFHYHSHHISRMIRGVPAIYSGEENKEPSAGVISYKDQQNYEDLKGKLLAAVKKVQKVVKQLPDQKYGIEPFSERLRKATKKSGKSTSQIAKEAGFTEAFLLSLMNDYKSIESIFEPYGLLKLCKLRNIPQDRYLNPGLWVLRRLSDTLNIRMSALIGEEDLDRVWHEPLMLLSQRGVTLKEFVEVSEDAEYLIMYQRAARADDKANTPKEVADSIFSLVESRRDGGSK